MEDCEKQGMDFLAKTGTTLDVVKAVPQKSPLWGKDGKHGIHYSVTLKNGRGSYTFDFWDSISAKEKEERTRIVVKPSAYSILACLDVMYEDTFEDFCSSFGYDTDSIMAEKTYRAILEQDRMLRKIFTNEQMEMLSEIA